MATKGITPETVDADQGKIVSVVGDTYRIVMTGEQTNDAYAMIDMLIPPGGGPGPHSHSGFQEAFYILEGEIEVRSESGVYVAKQGSFVNIPLGGLVHQFKNRSDSVAHVLCTVVPAGLELLFLEIGKPVKERELIKPSIMSAEDMQRLEGIAEKHGQKLFPPDFLEKS